VNRRALISSLGALLFSAGAAIGVGHLAVRKQGAVRAGKLVSLTPAITETLFALDAGASLGAVSDYCQLPPGVVLPRVGSSLTPNFEAIARVAPSLILSDDSAGAKRRELAAIAPCEVLPWLTLSEVVKSTARLGQVTSRAAAGQALAEKLDRRLSRTPARDAPRALVLLSYDPDRPAELWFIRQNSLHGAALGAAGMRNAVARDVKGLPRLSVEALLQLDPDLVVVITPPATSLEHKRRQVAAFSALSPLRAVALHRVGIVEATQSVGPSILTLVDKLSNVLEKLQTTAAPVAGFVE
jgi:ABC-type Fe3+-hydroxamate transport system substrate-binding protein